MSRLKRTSAQRLHVVRAALCVVLSSMGLGTMFANLTAGKAGAATSSPASRSWCSNFNSKVVAWADTAPNIPICGPGPAYGGAWGIVALPGPGGTVGAYFNGTPGFQCVELAERYLAVADGFGPISANGSSVVANYHAAYPRTTVVVNGTPGAIHHSPVRGDVISFSSSSSFLYGGDGHVAVVARSNVNNKTGDGRIVVAQQNVASNDYLYTLDVVNWRLEDPREPGHAEFQFPDAEWLHVEKLRLTDKSSALIAKVAPVRAAKPLFS